MCGLWIADDYKIMALQEQLPWLRLYVSVLNCPKVQRLPAPLFKHWINLLCVARSQDGILPGIADIAFALRIDVAEAETVVARLVDACLIDRTESGFMPHNWRIRQYRSDSSTERVRRHRLQRNVTETDEPEIGADSLKRYGNGLEQNRSDSDKSRQEPARLASKNEQSTPPGFDCEIFFERSYARHPKKGRRNIAMQYLSELLFREVQPEELERMHVKWCESDAWKHGGGRYVKQDLAEWILDKGWRYEPLTSGTESLSDRAAAQAIERMRNKG